jgi:hypothetical protein
MNEQADAKPRSYEKFHYGMRTAKNIERKMICEALHRLSAFDRLESYRYIGFGSAYFSDFILFHKSLGFDDMISIEKDLDKAKRFEFNCPFNCVTIEMGLSTEVLPILKWDKKSVVWLDYESALDSTMLADVSFFCARAPAGSVLLVTVNAQPGQDKIYGSDRLQRLERRIGSERIPPDLKAKHLAQWGTAAVFARIIKNEIDQRLHARNAAPGNEACKIAYRQLFHFNYADGAMMLTVGGMIYEKGQAELVGRCAFDNLAFVREDSEPFLIEAPALTYRELRHMDAQLPKAGAGGINAPGVPERDVDNYRLLYRYFPAFTEAEM